MLRKFILVAFMALVDPGSTVQLMSAQLVCFGYVLLIIGFSPYKKDEADFTNQVCCMPQCTDECVVAVPCGRIGACRRHGLWVNSTVCI